LYFDVADCNGLLAWQVLALGHAEICNADQIGSRRSGYEMAKAAGLASSWFMANFISFGIF
jgi:hypothetical protein